MVILSSRPLVHCKVNGRTPVPQISILLVYAPHGRSTTSSLSGDQSQVMVRRKSRLVVLESRDKACGKGRVNMLKLDEFEPHGDRHDNGGSLAKAHP
jgi:hypothetical protein